MLPPESSTVASQFAVLVDDPVAGYDDRNPVQAVCVSDGSLRRGRTNATRQVLIRDCLSVWNALQFLPHALLKRGAGIHKLDREFPERALEVVIQFRPELLDVLILAGNDCDIEPLPQRCELCVEHAPVRKLEETDTTLRGTGDQGPERALDPRRDNTFRLPTFAGRSAERTGEGIPKSAVRVEPMAKGNIIEIGTEADLLQRLPQSPTATVCLERHAVRLVEVASDAGGVKTDGPKERVGITSGGVPFDPRKKSSIHSGGAP